jgi:hypothetical protein
VTDTGAPGAPRFVVDPAGRPRVFLRLVLTPR